MANHSINLDDATESLVQAAAGDQPVDEFISAAARREAQLRHEAGRELARMADEAEASGSSGLTLDGMDRYLQDIIRRVEAEQA